MKKQITILALSLLFVAAATNAQQGEGRGPGQRQNPEAVLKMYKDSLGLSNAQADSVEIVLQELQSKREGLRNPDLTREERRAQMQELNQQRNARFKNILTPDQLKKLGEIEDRRRQQMQERNPGMRSGGDRR